MHKYPLIRTIYLYLFSLVGLVLVIIAAVDFIDMALKAFVFKQADAQEQLYNKEPRPAYPPFGIEKTKEIANEETATITLTTDERNQLRVWLAEYEQFNEDRKRVDFVVARRHQDAARNLAMLIVGFPLYLYHWNVIRKEAKEKKENA